VKARTTSLVLAFLVQLRLPFPNSPYPSYCDQTPATISKQGFTNKTPVQLPPRLIAPTKPAFRTSHREKSHGDTPKQDIRISVYGIRTRCYHCYMMIFTLSPLPGGKRDLVFAKRDVLV
jgi:hypothetical protein